MDNNKVLISLLTTIVCVGASILFMLYLLCDMSMSLNSCLKMQHHKYVTGEIKEVSYTKNGRAHIRILNPETEDTYIRYNFKYTEEYVLDDRSVIAKADTGKQAGILYEYIGGGKQGPRWRHIRQLSINQKEVWTYTPPYVMDTIFILISLFIIYYYISETYKKVKEGKDTSES